MAFYTLRNICTSAPPQWLLYRNFLSSTVAAALKKSVPTNSSLKVTQLDSVHKSFGGKMTNFAGWCLPIVYKDQSIVESHLHTRSKASLFDVSHMGQARIHGKDRKTFLETLVVGDIQALDENTSRLTLLTNENGGIIDDLIVTNAGNHLNLVLNAGCLEKDLAHLSSNISKAQSAGMDVTLEMLEDQALIALQGPEAMNILQPLVNRVFDLKKLPFMSAFKMPFENKTCFVNRCGYTGEDGFEISVPGFLVEKMVYLLLSNNDLKMAGLGARDTLRVEAGLCLYGSDIDEDITPVEAGLAWTIGKRRRSDGNFPGSKVILSQLKSGVEKKRVGIKFSKGSAARQGMKIQNENDEFIGNITSGIFSPCLQQPVAIGYIRNDYAKILTSIKVNIRGNAVSGEIVKMPFIQASYFKPK